MPTQIRITISELTNTPSKTLSLRVHSPMPSFPPPQKRHFLQTRQTGVWTFSCSSICIMCCAELPCQHKACQSTAVVTSVQCIDYWFNTYRSSHNLMTQRGCQSGGEIEKCHVHNLSPEKWMYYLHKNREQKKKKKKAYSSYSISLTNVLELISLTGYQY